MCSLEQRSATRLHATKYCARAETLWACYDTVARERHISTLLASGSKPRSVAAISDESSSSYSISACASVNVRVRMASPFLERWVGIRKLGLPHLIAVICVFHRADRSRMVSHLN